MFKLAIKNNIDFLDAYNNYGFLLSNFLDKPQKALYYFEVLFCKQKGITNPLYFFNYCDVLLKLEKVEKANEVY